MTGEGVGTLIIDIADRTSSLSLVGGASHEIPSPEQLTNALGRVHDHLDDVLIASPTIGAPTAVTMRGPHARALAQVEVGSRSIPAGYRLDRADADEVFRIVATEPPAERIHNPGLDPAHLHTIVPTCCIVLAVMRRLDLDTIDLDAIDLDAPELDADARSVTGD